MCGVLLVKSKDTISLDQHLAAVQTLEARGPDFTRYKHNNNIFIAQTVLRITGTDNYYNTDTNDFLSYNGEIYNYKWFGNFSSDTELVHNAVVNDTRKFKYFNGPWAWAWTDFNTVLYAADPQGERCLYHYQDESILIVASEVTAILKYIKPELVDIPYANKGWTMISQTTWHGITRVEPGMLYKDGTVNKKLDSIWDWISPQKYTWDEAVSEFTRLWDIGMTHIRPECDSALSFSGGIDSSLILAGQPNTYPISINVVGKDPVVTHVQEFLNAEQLLRLTNINVNEQFWAQEYIELVTDTKMPAQSWSHVGKWLVAKHAEPRVIFTGLAADELFGGYAVYQTIEYTQEKSDSPYSSNDHDNLWNRCLNAYNGDPRPATLLMDYWYQVVGVDAPGLDRLGAAWGKETRNPFMLRSIMEFALNLPIEFRIKKGQPKPILTDMFEKRWGKEKNYPKMGFAGHANDSLPWLNISVPLTGDRHRDWQTIAIATFTQLQQNPAT